MKVRMFRYRKHKDWFSFYLESDGDKIWIRVKGKTITAHRVDDIIENPDKAVELEPREFSAELVKKLERLCQDQHDELMARLSAERVSGEVLPQLQTIIKEGGV